MRWMWGVINMFLIFSGCANNEPWAPATHPPQSRESRRWLDEWSVIRDHNNTHKNNQLRYHARDDERMLFF